MKLKKFQEKDKKKRSIIVFTIACFLLVTGVILYQTFAIFEVNQSLNLINGQVEDSGDIYFAFYYDGGIQKDMPSKESGYVLDESQSYCSVNGERDNNIKVSVTEDDKIQVQGVETTRTKCNLYFRNYYQIKVNETEYQVSTTSHELTIESSGNILLCNNGITATEENNEIHLSNIIKDSTCHFYDTSNNAINNLDYSKNYILFLKDETETSTLTIPETKEVTIDLNGHTKNGTISNSGILYFTSSKENKGIIQGGDVTLITSNGVSHTEIENVKLKNTNGHTILANEHSYIKLENADLEHQTTTDRSSGIFTSENGKLEIITSNISAPYGIGGHGGNINVQDSNITATALVGIQTNLGYDSNLVISGNTTITAQTYGILIYQGTLELNGSTENYPTIKGLEQTGITLVYGIFKYQYGEIYGKQPINIQGATLTRQGTTLTTENQNGMYHTYLK